MEAASAPRPHALRVPKPRRLLAALSDERLVDQVRRGEAAAFEVLYDRYSAGILAFCRHMLRSPSDAEDATQHTFLAAHADIARNGNRELHVKAWLYTIARNRCLSMLRAQHELVTADGEIDIVSNRFSSDVEQREDLRALLADVQKLPREQREALVLAEVGALSHDEISEVIGCEASKVKSLVFQARTALIDRRLARETSCEEIREQVATLRGGALRRSHLRHHLDACPGCSEYREQVRRQRALLAVALPVVPSAALRSHVLGGLGIGGGSAAAAGTAGAGLTATAASTAGSGFGVAVAQGGLAKLGVVAALAVGGGGAVAVAENGGAPLLHHATPAASTSSGKSDLRRDDSAGGTLTHGRAAADSGNSANAPATTKAAPKKTTSHRSAKGAERGFTPTTGAKNRDAANDFAQARGRKNGTRKTNSSTPTGNATPKAERVKKAAPVKQAQPNTKSTKPKTTAPKADTPKANTPTRPAAPEKVQPTQAAPQQQTAQEQPNSESGLGSAITRGKALGTEKRNAAGGG